MLTQLWTPKLGNREYGSQGLSMWARVLGGEGQLEKAQQVMEIWFIAGPAKGGKDPDAMEMGSHPADSPARHPSILTQHLEQNAGSETEQVLKSGPARPPDTHLLASCSGKPDRGGHLPEVARVCPLPAYSALPTRTDPGGRSPPPPRRPGSPRRAPRSPRGVARQRPGAARPRPHARARPARTCRPRAPPAGPAAHSPRRPLTARASRRAAAGHRGRTGACAPRATQSDGPGAARRRRVGTGSAAAGLRPASAHGGALPVTRGPARPQRVVRGGRGRAPRSRAPSALGPRARGHRDPGLGHRGAQSPRLPRTQPHLGGPRRPALALETPAGSRAGPRLPRTRAASSFNRDSRSSAERQSLLAPSQAPRWWREAVTPMSGLGEASCRPACPQIRTGQGRSLPGRGPRTRADRTSTSQPHRALRGFTPA
ncbi:translation initiation factor IF-2-like [Cervus elaphus]|uniref:translation initiation factor IF-2-like n=1 Tax=Cervus canadensis TaxID=1574408 RepID=UPI001CA31D93|nr:translation initiation factor IF-2-like [Cervus canadensis]XP_043771488.1 translation initiation factor IF-2-like [Cervus elaphus]